jgi:hypothetical protein
MKNKPWKISKQKKSKIEIFQVAKTFQLPPETNRFVEKVKR